MIPIRARATSKDHFRARRLRRHLRENPRGGAMTEAAIVTADIADDAAVAPQIDDSLRPHRARPAAAARVGARRAASRLAVLRPAARCARAHCRTGKERPALRRHRRDAARVRARLRRRLLFRRAAAVPAAAIRARDHGRRALHHGVDGHPEIRAGAVADPVVRHRRHAEARHRHADGVLHRVHHHLRRHAQRRSAPRQHGAHRRRQRARKSRARSSGFRCCRISSPGSRSRCRAR